LLDNWNFLGDSNRAYELIKCIGYFRENYTLHNFYLFITVAAICPAEHMLC